MRRGGGSGTRRASRSGGRAPGREGAGVTVAALEVEGVGHRFGGLAALDDVSFRVEPGSFTALLGVNGAGKTTLFNLVTRLYANRSGRIAVRGHDLRRTPRKALATMGLVFQSRSLDNDLTVRQNFVYHGALHGMSARRTLARADALLERAGVADVIDRKVRTLSGGQARRVEIARAMTHEPSLVLCDEATVGLDVKSRRDIVAHLHDRAAADGIGVLWATHLIEEIGPDDPVVVLHRGKVLARGTGREIVEGQGAEDLAGAFLALTEASA